MADPERLVRAWETVRRNDDEDGIRSSGVDRFADDLTTNLQQLADDLAAGRYQPAALIGVDIPKARGGKRRLKIPTVADRIIERSLADVITEHADLWLSPWSLAYRQNIAVTDAHRLLAAERDAGATHVVRADLRDCFERFDHHRVLTALADALDPAADPAPLLTLVQQLCARPSWWRGSLHVADRGIAQGSPLSPLLCNLYLDALDRALAAAGTPAIRYADDLALPADSAQHAETALALLRQEVTRMGLALNDTKTSIMSFADGFAFLGEEFTPHYPNAQPPRQQPAKRTLYIGRQGALLRVDKGTFIVNNDKEKLLTVPTSHVGRVVLFGAVAISAGARSHVLYQKVPVVLLSRRGSYLGRLDSSDTAATATRRRQFTATADHTGRLEIARAIVTGKLANQRALLQRYARAARDPHTVAAAADTIRELGRNATTCTTLGELLGHEGAAAQRYFAAYAQLLPDGIDFPGRRRRPPTDIVNAMLSLGYACLTAEATGALAAAGLDPGVGFLHADADRPSLALDLIEELRTTVVDTVVLNCLRRAITTPDQTRTAPDRGGVLLTDPGRNAYLAQLEERMLTLFGYTPAHSRVSYRRALHLQARQLSILIRTDEHTRPGAFQTIRWR